MNRKDFIKNCGITCLGGALVSTMLESCGTTQSFTCAIAGSDMIVPLTHFEASKDKPGTYKKYIIAHHDNLQYPIAVYRISENTYTALWMRCTHQGSELRAFGDQLSCPAHGSEFTKEGAVQNGPADTPLKTFPVLIEKDQLKISLK